MRRLVGLHYVRIKCVVLIGVVLHAQCNDKCDIYADGHLVGKTTTKTKIWSGTIPRTSRLITVDAENTVGSIWSIVVRASGFKSSEQWKCSHETFTDLKWTTTNYNDSSWADVVQQGIKVNWLFEGAGPIWSHVRPNDLGHVRFRGKFGKLKYIVFFPFLQKPILKHILMNKQYSYEQCTPLSECGGQYRCEVTGNDYTCLCEDGYTFIDNHQTCRGECYSKSKTLYTVYHTPAIVAMTTPSCRNQ